MIGYLKGRIIEQTAGSLLLATGSTDSCVGYSLTVPAQASYLDLVPGSVAELFVYTHVREDQLDLYGFRTRLEKELFLALLSVSGIGPKGALGLVSGMSAEELINTIVSGDSAALTKIPGVGKKTAERIVVELADSIRKKIGASHSVSTLISASASSREMPTGASAMARDAKSALMGLGYREADISSVLNRVLNESDSKPERVEDLIRRTLQQLM
jgi:Holliday junction DNA helicase RuvA